MKQTILKEKLQTFKKTFLKALYYGGPLCSSYFLFQYEEKNLNWVRIVILQFNKALFTLSIHFCHLISNPVSLMATKSLLNLKASYTTNVISVQGLIGTLNNWGLVLRFNGLWKLTCSDLPK